MIASGTTTIDKMVADSQARLAAFINRTAAQHLRRMRESWDEAAATAPATTTPTRLATKPDAFSNRLSNPWPNPWNHETGAVPYPWDDITPVNDEPGTAWHEIAGLAIGLLCFQVVVFVLAFSLGVLTGMRS